MEIIVAEIPSEGLTIDCSRDEAWFSREALKEDAARFCIEDILFHCVAYRMGQKVSIRGTVDLRCSTACTRCLETVHLELRGDFFYVLAPVQFRDDDQSDEMELAADDLETGVYDNGRIDLEPMIAEQVFLLLPVRVLCDENCRGLCPVCGTNLNLNDCGHEISAKADSPFAILKDYKVPGKRS